MTSAAYLLEYIYISGKEQTGDDPTRSGPYIGLRLYEEGRWRKSSYWQKIRHEEVDMKAWVNTRMKRYEVLPAWHSDRLLKVYGGWDCLVVIGGMSILLLRLHCSCSDSISRSLHLLVPPHVMTERHEGLLSTRNGNFGSAYVTRIRFFQLKSWGFEVQF